MQRPFYKEHKLTSFLMFICILLFVIQLLTGVDAMNPTSNDLLSWGANWLFLSYTHEPWRMVTAVFLHVGFIHLAFNMYALTIFGQFSEGVFGRVFYACIFILSGIGGNILNNSYNVINLFYETEVKSVVFPPLSAGASGGIMGLGGALLVCTLMKFSLHDDIKLNGKGLVIVMFINLIMGFVIPNIDNAAHIGGAITGALMAFILVVGKKYNQVTQSKVIAITLVMFLFISVFWCMQYLYGDFIQKMLSLLLPQ